MNVNKRNRDLHSPGEIYLEKSRRGTFGEDTYGVYIAGDDTLEGSTVTLGLFFDKEIAEDFLQLIAGSGRIEKIRQAMFKHPEDEIAIEKKIKISAEEWERIYPELRKYRRR